MATELEELRFDLEWIEYLMGSAMSALNEIESGLDGDRYKTRGESELVLAYTVELADSVSTLNACMSTLRGKALDEWHSHVVDGRYHARIASRHSGAALEYEHAVRMRKEAAGNG